MKKNLRSGIKYFLNGVHQVLILILHPYFAILTVLMSEILCLPLPYGMERSE